MINFCQPLLSIIASVGRSSWPILFQYEKRQVHHIIYGDYFLELFVNISLKLT